MRENQNFPIDWDWSGMRRLWFKAASEFTGFHEKLAANLAENELSGCRSVLDAGCGLGLLSLAFSHYFDSVTAIDMNSDAISSLKDDMAFRATNNISALCGDCLEYTGGQDAAVLCFFRAPDFRLLSSRYGRVVRVVTAGSKYLSADDGQGRHCMRDGLDGLLVSQSIKSSYRELSLEFGQPLRDLADAKAFVKSQTPGASDPEIENYLNNILTETGNSEFPLYIPHLKEMGIYLINFKEDCK